MSFDEEITGRIIQCSIRVHQKLGPGFVENIYQRAMLIELRLDRIRFEVQKKIEIYYEGIKIGRHAIDLIVEDEVVVELKSVKALGNEQYAQVRSYLRASGLKIGLLINFAGERADYRRITSPPSPAITLSPKRKEFPSDGAESDR